MASVTLYTRRNCHLCEEAKAVLEKVRAEIPFELEAVDVDSNPVLTRQYGEEVPVILLDGKKRFKYRVEEDRLRRLLMETAQTPAAPAGKKSSGAQFFMALGVFVILVGVVLRLFPPEEQERSFAKEGAQAIAFDLPAVDGSSHLSWQRDLAGRVVLLNFWATWCAPCLEEMPSLNRLHARLEAEGLTVVAVSEDEHTGLPASYVAKEKFQFPVLFDDDHRVASQWGTFKYPETYIVGRDGVVKKKLFGPAEWDSPQAIEYFRELLASGTEVAPSAPEIPSDPDAARSPEREAMRKKMEERGGTAGSAPVE
ncbi:MAG: redoxin domain-containing protein [Bdellovibrionota bacterium]